MTLQEMKCNGIVKNAILYKGYLVTSHLDTGEYFCEGWVAASGEPLTEDNLNMTVLGRAVEFDGDFFLTEGEAMLFVMQKLESQFFG